MGWKDHLNTAPERRAYPYTGESNLHLGSTTYTILGRHPERHGWHEFEFRSNKRALYLGRPAEPDHESLSHHETGYLVGDRFISDKASAAIFIADKVNLATLGIISEKLHLVPPHLITFARVITGRFHESGPLIFEQETFPMGPEALVRDAYVDRAPNLYHIKGVPPALVVAFSFLNAQRLDIEERRRKARLEEERLARLTSLEHAAGRRALAQTDFVGAASAALAISGAKYLHHQLLGHGEVVVQFEHVGRRFECVCHVTTLQIIDAGICLREENGDDEFERGTRGDTWLTLESLPPVIAEAVRQGRLVVFRHAE